MAEPIQDVILIAVILVVLAIAVIAFIELKFLRKSMRARRVRAAKRVDSLPDDAHNALLTTKAIASALRRGGVESDEVDGLIREAQVAYDRRNHRVVLELTAKAKEKLTALKARHAASGDLAKLEAMPVRAAPDEPTMKERIHKEFPPNMAQARFTLELAEAAIGRGREAGRDVGQAEQILVHAKSLFDGNDYDAALVSARQAQRSAEAGPIEGWTPAPPTPRPAAPVATVALACPSCGAPLRADDLFCRKCGTRRAPASCPACGTPAEPEDAFCPKCGATLGA